MAAEWIWGIVVATDLWVHDLLVQADIYLDAQGSNIIELNNALKTASKRGTGKAGYPEYCGVVKDFVILIEDKASIHNHIIEINYLSFEFAMIMQGRQYLFESEGDTDVES